MTEQKQLPKFEGVPLIQIPENIPRVNFLGGDFGKWVDEEVKGRYGKFKVISNRGIQYNESNGLIEGSNTFYLEAANEVLRENFPSQNIRTASQADLENILRIKTLELKGTYVDSGLVLISQKYQNSYLAKILADQLTLLGQNLDSPIYIQASSLDLIKDEHPPSKLAFSLREDAQFYVVPQLVAENYRKRFNTVNETTGFPDKFVRDGTRTFYVESSGLGRLYLNGVSSLNSEDVSLDISGSRGRMVLVSA